MRQLVRFLMWVLILTVILAGLLAWLWPRLNTTSGGGVYSAERDQRVIDWINNPSSHPEWAIQSRKRCGTAPFLLPTDGYIGYLWDDGFQPGHRHQGLDIFGSAPPGETATYAAADGYLTREPGWKSAVILRVPHDPLAPSRQIWLYYAHMADPDGNSFISTDFPPGSKEVFVKAGRQLGYQGNFSGTPGSPVGVHLHFSIVLDDGQGKYRNELQIENTLDPSPYLGIQANARQEPPDIPVCPSSSAIGNP